MVCKEISSYGFHLSDSWKDSYIDHKQHQGSVEVIELLIG
jgi:hypothetical protein